MTNHLSKAIEKEHEGDLHAAAEHYALSAFEHLVNSDYENNRTLREGLSEMLEAVSADVRCGNDHRATVHFEMTEKLYRNVATAEDPAIGGLGWEWLGDGHLLLGDEEAITCYERAFENFRQISFNDQMYWGSAPEYDSAYGALEAFFEAQGAEYPSDHSLEFMKRVKRKMELFDELYS